ADVGVTEDHPAVGDERLLPVAARRADGEELDRDDVPAVLGHPAVESDDALDAALALRPLEQDAGVVLALDRLRPAAVADGLGPAGAHVHVARVVHDLG